MKSVFKTHSVHFDGFQENQSFHFKMFSKKFFILITMCGQEFEQQY